jgi:hypothetical protein
VYGFAAISNANGWAIAIAGALIVMSGLTVLATVISQLPRLTSWLEQQAETRRRRKSELPPAEPVQRVEDRTPPRASLDPAELVSRFKPLAAALGDRFELQALYRAAREEDCPHPHLSIRNLIGAGVLKPAGDGTYCWNG